MCRHINDLAPCSVNLYIVLLWILLLWRSIQRPCCQQGSPCQDPAGNRTTYRPPDHSKEMQTAVVWQCLPFIRSGQNHLARHSERGKKTRQTEDCNGLAASWLTDLNQLCSCAHGVMVSLLVWQWHRAGLLTVLQSWAQFQEAVRTSYTHEPFTTKSHTYRQLQENICDVHCLPAFPEQFYGQSYNWCHKWPWC